MLEVILAQARVHEVKSKDGHLGGHCLSLSIVGKAVLNNRKFRNAIWEVIGGNVTYQSHVIGHFWLEAQNGGVTVLFLDLTSNQFEYECPLMLYERPDNYQVGTPPIPLSEDTVNDMVAHTESLLEQAGY